MGGRNDINLFFSLACTYIAKRRLQSGISSRNPLSRRTSEFLSAFAMIFAVVEHMRGECAQIIFDAPVIPNFYINLKIGMLLHTCHKDE